MGMVLHVLYVDDIRTSLETHNVTVWYGEIFTFFLYVDDIRTSLETHNFKVWYGDSFIIFYM
jgi:hypothetical protein